MTTTKLYTSDSYATSTSATTTIPIWKSATGDNKDVLSAGYYAIYIDCGSSTGNTLDKLTFTGAASTNYTVTLNPNDGSYASTPDGWTAGTGVYTKSVASGTALAIPEPSRSNYDFNGWKSGLVDVVLSAGKLTVSKDTTLTAQWVAEATKYTVTYTVGAGSGTAPAAAQYAEGATFNLPGQGEMTAPAGKAFDGWKANGAGDKLAANYEYTMGNAAVEFVAQWKAVPQTIFDWTKGTGAQITADKTSLNGNNMGTLTTGTSVLARKLGDNNIDNNNAGYKLGVIGHRSGCALRLNL